MKIVVVCIALLMSILPAFSQLSKGTHGPTDTLLYKQFYNLLGNPSVLTYGYSNGNGYFFGTNFLDIDQNPNTPTKMVLRHVLKVFQSTATSRTSF